MKWNGNNIVIHTYTIISPNQNIHNIKFAGWLNKTNNKCNIDILIFWWLEILKSKE